MIALVALIVVLGASVVLIDSVEDAAAWAAVMALLIASAVTA